MGKLSVAELLDAIGSLTLVEAGELVKAMEEKFGISAAAPVAVAVAGGAGAAAEVEEKTEFDVILTGFGDSKVNVIKEVRAITGTQRGQGACRGRRKGGKGKNRQGRG